MKATPSKFPGELLNSPKPERLAYFKEHTVAHNALAEADEKLMRAINEPGNASLIFVFGPPGVGKTTLRRRVVMRLTEEASADPSFDPGHIPVVSLDAKAAELREFSWKDYYKRALLSLDEPLVDKKANYDMRPRNKAGHLVLNAKPDLAEMRYALEEAVKHRQPKAFVIDDAQHMGRLPSGRKLQDQLDCIKSLADTTKTTHVLLGSYDLLDFRNLSGQLSRRSRDIHFPRYRFSDGVELKIFKSVVWDFQRHLPLAEEPDLVRHYEFLYERSIGCVGVLKDWLVLCLDEAVENKSASLTIQQLEKTAFSISQCLSMAMEAAEGEQKFHDMEARHAELQKILGLDEKSAKTKATAHSEGSKRHEHRSSNKNQVGKRVPGRDKVGAERA